jgi:hypothetical protein
MGYILIFVALVGLLTYFNQRNRIHSIKRNGVKTTGVIVTNKEFNPDSARRLGGNINDPTIKFATLDGQIIIGKPIVGFISQDEVAVPTEVNIVYNSRNPKQFYIDTE